MAELCAYQQSACLGENSIVYFVTICTLRKHRDAQPWEWQRGCFDRLLRSDENPRTKWIYAKDNPVRHGFVQRAQDWPHYLDFINKPDAGSCQFFRYRTIACSFRVLGHDEESTDRMRRVFGLETEYGITLSGAETVDVVAESIELVRRYTDHGALMKWDYDLEDPHLDARGFRARELLQDTDESAYYEIDKRRPLSFEEIKSDLVLSNGARFYNDHAHPEYSTPECTTLRGLPPRTKPASASLQNARAAEI